MTTTPMTRTRRALYFPEPVDHLVGTSLEGGLFEIQRARIIQIPVNEAGSTLEEMQRLVKGFIEALPMPLDHSGYMNEEAKLSNPPMPLNTEADALWRRACREQGLMTQPGDYINGPVVIVGPLDDEGWDTDLTDDFVALVKSMAIQVDE